MKSETPKDPEKREAYLRDIVESVMGQSNKVKTLDDVFLKGATVNKTVQEMLRERQTVTFISREELFAFVHKLYLDALVQHRLSEDELLFLYAYNATKILLDQARVP